ncbi:MAG: DUF3782 domain-containing protein [Prochlorotrichaceae cyanobacterium]|jgi:hypothetical protein
MATTPQEVWQLLGELIQAQKETERIIQASKQETEHRFQETERLIKESSERLDQKLGKLGNRLGEFVEWQVRPAALRLFRERGLKVNELCSNVEVANGEDEIEVDLLAVNTTEAVVIEVKSKLTNADVDEHLERMEKFKRLLPRYQGLNLFGAVAGLVIPQDVARYAYRRGFFVIAQSGDNVVILNDEKFRPKAW